MGIEQLLVIIDIRYKNWDTSAALKNWEFYSHWPDSRAVLNFVNCNVTVSYKYKLPRMINDVVYPTGVVNAFLNFFVNYQLDYWNRYASSLRIRLIRFN